MNPVTNSLVRTLCVSACLVFSITGKAQPTVLTSDSLALVAIYNTNNGPNWTVKTNWLTGPVDTWHGVTVAAGRVSEINLSNNGLSRGLPNDLGNLSELTDLDLSSNNLFSVVPKSMYNLTKLKNLNLSGNQLTDLPVLSTSQMIQLNVSDNHFFFNDLVRNLNIPSFIYSPQKSFDIGAGTRFVEGERVIISCPDSAYSVGNSQNQYIWYKNNVLLPGREAIDLEFQQISNDDLGEYKVEVSNSILPDLVLTGYGAISEVYTKQESFFEFVNAGDLTNEGYDPGSNFETDVNYSGQWGDFNNDGFDDISVSTLSGRERSYFYLNKGDGTFEKLPSSSYFYSQGRLVAWGDYNNDGWLDAYAPGGAISTDSVQTAYIFKNNGNKTFSRIPLDVKSSAGVWSDTDNDGDLDLIVNESGGRIKLFRNDGEDTFNPLEVFEGTTSIEWLLLAVDINNDFKQDFFATKDGVRDLHIATGDNQFDLDSSQPITTDIIDRSRGASFGDIDNDGDYDAYLPISSGGPIESNFYINDGSGNFISKPSSELCSTALFGPGRGSVFFDFDNDGFVDLLTTVRPNVQSNSRWTLFRNNGNLTFSKVGGQNFRTDTSIIGASVADFDNDGFLDIFTVSGGLEFNGLYHNKGNANNWLQIKLVGKYSNRSGIGSKIDVYAGGLRRHHQVIVSNGFANNNSLTAHFGVGTNNVIDSVVVRWPSGIKQKIIKPDVNQKMVVNEDPQGIQTITFSPVSDKVFGSEPFMVSATSSSKLPVAFSSSSDKVIIVGDLVTMVKPGKVSITATQEGDTYYSAVTEEIEFCINPAKPTITSVPESLDLQSSSVSGNQWYKDQEIIEGATSQAYSVTEDGTYKVKVEIEGCSSDFSDAREVVTTALDEIQNAKRVIISPNPVSDQLVISFNGLAGKKSVSILCSDSRKLATSESSAEEVTVSFKDYPPGVYFISVSTDSSIIVKRIVKIH